tara:strand:+ start:60 stop:1463 length:1404 start_codon:yes stop_codon:yes gene_type:complete
MADPITVKTTPLMIKWGKDTIFDWSDDVTYYYKEEMVASGKKGNRTFEVTILRSDTPDFSVSTEIGTRNKTTGVITLNDGADLVEEAKLKTLTNKLKGNSTALKEAFAQFGDLSDEEKTKLNNITGTKNVATTDEVGITTAQAISIGSQTLQTISVEGRNFRKSYEDLSYPGDIRTSKQDRIRFEQSYSEGSILDTSAVIGSSNDKAFQKKIKTIEGSVTLPIVTGIQDENSVDWKGATLNPIQALAGAGALGIFETVRDGGTIDDAFAQGAAMVGDMKSQLMKGSQVGSDVASAINVYLAQQAVGAQGLLSRTTGAILNPNLEMLFGGPQLRRFTFQFLMSPRDAKEATQVRKIIRFFKQGMSVKTSASNVFLKAPNVFNIQYQAFTTDGREIPHPSINRIKTCALTSCNVQYTPNNSYMTYDDPSRTMQAYQITLQFGELDPIYDDDYTDEKKGGDLDLDTQIGY